MKTFQVFFVALVAFEHIYFMILEMFYWDKPKGLKIFGHSIKKATASRVLAKNQGLYNGFLATGLIWALIDIENFTNLSIFFLSCAIIAGIFGAYTTKRIKLFYIQAVPALIGLLLILTSIFFL